MSATTLVLIVVLAGAIAVVWFHALCWVFGHQRVTITEFDDPWRTEMRDQYGWCARCRRRLPMEGTD